MKKEMMEILACPMCKGDLELEIAEALLEENQALEGAGISLDGDTR